MNPFYSRPLISFAPLANGLRLIVLISSLVVLASSLAAAQQNPVGAAESSAAAAGDPNDKKVASIREDDTGKQTSASPSLVPAQSVVAADDSSAASVQAPSGNSAESAAKDAAQNPVANTISIPLQNNTFFKFGGYKRAVNALEIEPVIPFRLSDNWILITRTIVPLIYVPRVSPSQGENFGLGNLNPQFYLSPAHPGKIIWGVGPQLSLPTATDKTLGVNKWGAGPAAVILTKRGHWLFGSLVNNVWTGGAGKQGHQDPIYPTVLHSLNQMTLNPFVYYNMKAGWYFVSSLIMTADWAAKPDSRWTVPVGGGAGRLFKLGPQIFNARMQFWKDVKQPTGGQSWTMQTQVQLIFPHK
jgi:hypothetical protein